MKISIKTKIFAGFGATLIISIVALVISYNATLSAQFLFNNLIQIDAKKVAMAKDIRFYDLTLTDCVRGLIISPGNAEDNDKYVEYLDLIIAAIDDLRKMPLSPEETKILDELKAADTQLAELETVMMDPATSRTKVLSIFQGEYSDTRKVYQERLNALTVYKRHLSAN